MTLSTVKYVIVLGVIAHSPLRSVQRFCCVTGMHEVLVMLEHQRILSQKDQDCVDMSRCGFNSGIHCFLYPVM